jgi:hypothetical protein
VSESGKHTLRYPITQRFRDSGGEREEEITEITLRRMKAKDMRLADKLGGEVSRSLEMIAALSGLPIRVVDELDAFDVEALGEIIAGFTDAGQKTGATS